MTDLPPPRLAQALADRYRIERALGAGGMATVYLAEDLKHDRLVAIKVLKPELAAVLGAERFVVEIKTTAQLQHPHILPLFDSGEADGFLYYVMPYIQGETIRERLNRETQLGVEEAVRITREIADALDYAHRAGVIHRDIKPENILLHDGRPMVMDFGIALAVSAAAGGRMTETGLSLGTPHYMSPEQATADKAITARSDVYSLASVCYEMLTGEPPHMGNSAQQIIMKIIAEPAQPATALRKAVPPHVSAALSHALEKLPADRFDSAKAFADALGNVQFTAGGDRATDVGGARRTRDRRVLGAAVAVALVASALAVVAWARSGEATARPLSVEIALPAAHVRSPGMPAFVAIAPRGDAIVYVDTVDGTQQLWIKERGAIAPRVIPGTVGASAPSLSPDGSQVAFFVGQRLMRMPVTGGAASTAADSVPSPPSPAAFRSPAAWLDDGSMVLSTFQQVLLVPANGGPPRRLVTNDSLGVPILQVSAVPGRRAALIAGCQASGCGSPQVFLARLDDLKIVPLIQGAPTAWAIEGDRLVYVTGDGSMFAAALDVEAGTVGAPTPLPGNVTIGALGAALTVSRDGTMLYVTGGGPPTRRTVELVRLAADREPIVIPGTTGLEVSNQSRLSVSPDGRAVLVALASGGADAQSYRGTYLTIRSLETGDTRRFTTGGAANFRGSWSPDGRRILWVSNRRNGHFEAWSQAADGAGEPVLMVSEARDVYDAVFSPDGQWLIYRTDDNAPGSGDIYARRISGDTAAIPIAVTTAEETSPAVSPDGQWIAYAERAGERKEVIVRSFPDPSRSRTQVSAGGGSEPRWSRDGRAVIYRKPTGAFVSVTVVTDGAFRVEREAPIGGDGTRYLRNDDTHQWDLLSDGRELLVARLAGDAPETVTPLRLIYEERTIPSLGGRR